MNSVQRNFSTIAIVPVTDDVPLTAFTYELYHSLSAIGKYRLLILALNCKWNDKWVLEIINVTVIC